MTMTALVRTFILLLWAAGMSSCTFLTSNLSTIAGTTLTGVSTGSDTASGGSADSGSDSSSDSGSDSGTTTETFADPDSFDLLDDAQNSLYSNGGTMDLPVTMAKLDGGTLDSTKVTISVGDLIETSESAIAMLSASESGPLLSSTDRTVTFTGVAGAVTDTDVIRRVLVYIDDDTQTIVTPEDDGSFTATIAASPDEPILLSGLTADTLEDSVSTLPTFYSYDSNLVVEEQFTDMESGDIASNVYVDNNGFIYFQLLGSDSNYELWRKNPDGTDAVLLIDGITDEIRYLATSSDGDNITFLTDSGELYYFQNANSVSSSLSLSINGDEEVMFALSFENGIYVKDLEQTLPADDWDYSYQIHYVGDATAETDGYVVRNATAAESSDIKWYPNTIPPQVTNQSFFTNSFLAPALALTDDREDVSEDFYVLGTQDNTTTNPVPEYDLWFVPASQYDTFNDFWANRVRVKRDIPIADLAWMSLSSVGDFVFSDADGDTSSVIAYHYSEDTDNVRNMGTYNSDAVVIAPSGGLLAMCNLATGEIMVRDAFVDFDGEAFTAVSDVDSCETSKKGIVIDKDYNIFYYKNDANSDEQLVKISSDSVAEVVPTING